ncbi:hypothetical protein EV11_1087 [Prochlorococcus sp. SS52]|nr:hypothetical protein EV04_0028 [Prochlorococcus marinus str. LG]KGG22559.1 hypothetical protein EV08_0074 [Prochlorococcus marinus str. SS2]KGG24402.1 hypothetical protein EV09_0309 [Prochlorococcus marinus str. SS35]KGG34174.1 hypothetical protein EV10_0020 [Prochlorococcus marinus str. SS51]KGG35813.1 hypothetical protein EV11_1087 [Prochlorococcus sp. SS52]
MFSAIFSLGGIYALISSFGNDDDDQDSGGTGLPSLSTTYATTPA